MQVSSNILTLDSSHPWSVTMRFSCVWFLFVLLWGWGGDGGCAVIEFVEVEAVRNSGNFGGKDLFPWALQ
jgi:hypothetical protein